jgi:hypothetical protein
MIVEHVGGPKKHAVYVHKITRVGDNGIASLELAVQKDPSEGKVWFSLGQAYQRAGRQPDALSSLSNAGQRGYRKAYQVIRELEVSRKDGKVGQLGSKVVWNASLKEAGPEVMAAYDSDLKLSSKDKQFANLKDACNQFFESHSFPKHPKLTKERFYQNVHKAIQ